MTNSSPPERNAPIGSLGGKRDVTAEWMAVRTSRRQASGRAIVGLDRFVQEPSLGARRAVTGVDHEVGPCLQLVHPLECTPLAGDEAERQELGDGSCVDPRGKPGTATTAFGSTPMSTRPSWRAQYAERIPAASRCHRDGTDHPR